MFKILELGVAEKVADRDIIAAALVVFGVACIGLVLSQYYAPSKLRPLTILKLVFDRLRNAAGNALQNRRTMSEIKAQKRAQEAHVAPPYPQPAQTESSPTKPCPYCAEPILQAAIKCKYCGEFLSGDPLQFSSPRRVKTSEDSFLTRSRGCGDIVIFGPLFFILAGALLLYSC